MHTYLFDFFFKMRSWEKGGGGGSSLFVLPSGVGRVRFIDYYVFTQDRRGASSLCLIAAFRAAAIFTPSLMGPERFHYHWRLIFVFVLNNTRPYCRVVFRAPFGSMCDVSGGVPCGNNSRSWPCGIVDGWSSPSYARMDLASCF